MSSQRPLAAQRIYQYLGFPIGPIDVLVTVEVPVEHEEHHWACQFHVGPPLGGSYTIHGVDSVQALLGAFTILRVMLEADGDFRYFGTRNLALTTNRKRKRRRARV